MLSYSPYIIYADALYAGALFLGPCITTNSGNSSSGSSSSSSCQILLDSETSFSGNQAQEAGADIFAHDLEALLVTPSAARPAAAAAGGGGLKVHALRRLHGVPSLGAAAAAAGGEVLSDTLPQPAAAGAAAATLVEPRGEALPTAAASASAAQAQSAPKATTAAAAAAAAGVPKVGGNPSAPQNSETLQANPAKGDPSAVTASAGQNAASHAKEKDQGGAKVTKAKTSAASGAVSAPPDPASTVGGIQAACLLLEKSGKKDPAASKGGANSTAKSSSSSRGSGLGINTLPARLVKSTGSESDADAESSMEGGLYRWSGLREMCLPQQQEQQLLEGRGSRDQQAQQEHEGGKEQQGQEGLQGLGKEEYVLLGADTQLPPVAVLVQDELAAAVKSPALSQQIVVSARVEAVPSRPLPQPSGRNNSGSSSSVTGTAGMINGDQRNSSSGSVDGTNDTSSTSSSRWSGGSSSGRRLLEGVQGNITTNEIAGVGGNASSSNPSKNGSRGNIEGSSGVRAYLEGQTQLVPQDGLVRFSNLQLLGPPGDKFIVYFTAQQISSTAPAAASPLAARSMSLLVQLPECKAGQVVRLSSQGLPSGCTTCSAPLFSFDPRLSSCIQCPPQSSKCGQAQMLPKPGYFQWHPLSPQLLQCPDAWACKPDESGFQRMQELQTAAAANVSAVSTANGSSFRRKLSATAAVTEDGSSSSSSRTGMDLEFQQLQCTDGYTGPLCASCISTTPHPSSADTVPTAAVSGGNISSTGIAKRYGRYHQACKECPSQRSLSVLYYILARLLDLGIVAGLVALVAHERRKRLRKLAAQAVVGQRPVRPQQQQPRKPGKVVGVFVAWWNWLEWCCKQVFPPRLRNAWAMAPMLMREKGRPAKKDALSTDQLVQVQRGKHWVACAQEHALLAVYGMMRCQLCSFDGGHRKRFISLLQSSYNPRTSQLLNQMERVCLGGVGNCGLSGT